MKVKFILNQEFIVNIVPKDFMTSESETEPTIAECIEMQKKLLEEEPSFFFDSGPCEIKFERLE